MPEPTMPIRMKRVYRSALPSPALLALPGGLFGPRRALGGVRRLAWPAGPPLRAPEAAFARRFPVVSREGGKEPQVNPYGRAARVVRKRRGGAGAALSSEIVPAGT
jgi:hypothetical protein